MFVSSICDGSVSGTGLEEKRKGRGGHSDVVIKRAPFQFSIAFNIFVINSFCSLPFLYLSYYLKILALLKLIILAIN